MYQGLVKIGTEGQRHGILDVVFRVAAAMP
jgi:hypothetical protein